MNLDNERSLIDSCWRICYRCNRVDICNYDNIRIEYREDIQWYEWTQCNQYQSNRFLNANMLRQCKLRQFKHPQMSLTSVRVSWQGLLKQPECADNIVVRTFRSVATTHNASTFLNNFDTWWSRETVTLNFSRMEVKSTNNGLPQWNLGRFWYFR